jgi:hypothetical protein
MQVVFILSHPDGQPGVLWAGRLPFRPHDWDIVRFARPDDLSPLYQVIGVSYLLDADPNGDGTDADPTLHAHVAPYDTATDDRRVAAAETEV